MMGKGEGVSRVVVLVGAVVRVVTVSLAGGEVTEVVCRAITERAVKGETGGADESAVDVYDEEELI